MHPVLFEIHVPSFMQGILPDVLTIYTYGFFIFLGAILGFSYMAWQGKKSFGTSLDVSNSLLLLLLISGIVGGKILFFFEAPSYFLENPGELFGSRGFVFYGSLGLSIPAMLWFFRKYKIPTLEMLDIMAITTGIVHMLGRMGCFMAGCCHGIPWEGPLAVIFTDPVCLARPLNTPLHPTQLYSFSMILLVTSCSFLLKQKKQFHGQVFISYLILYSIGRAIIEVYRGDQNRGYIIEDYVSHSQLFALIFILVAGYFYLKLKRKDKRVNN